MTGSIPRLEVVGTVSYRLLGALAVLRDGQQVDVGPEQRQRVLAALLLKANQAVSPEELVAAAWDTTPPVGAEDVIRGHIGVLRELVDPDPLPGGAELLIELADGNYVLCVAAENSDLGRFARDVQVADGLRATGRQREAAAKLRTALRLWQGPPLQGLPGRLFEGARSRLLGERARAEAALMETERKPGPPSPPSQVPAVPVYSPPPVYQQAQSVERQSLAKLIVLKMLGAAVPVVTFGMVGWLLTGLVAIKRGSVALGLSAVAYLATTTWFTLYVALSDDPEFSNGQALVTLLYLSAGIACAIQAAIVIGSPNHRMPPGPQYLQQQPPPPPSYPPPFGYSSSPAVSADAVLRNQARQIATYQPALARTLGIGRPDLPRQFDDGGLLDLNSAPVEWLATLPGVTRPQADAIVLSRTQHGRFRLVDELWTRGLLSPGLAPQLADRLVLIDVQDSAGGHA
ncbi:MAG: hypothetical protein QOH03_2585 [Kribbellaceae bacterium]|nr:hypothetical protein [Kribbellaceae bacterium]